MPRYKITAKWEGEATREIDAANEDAAMTKAYEDGGWCGFAVMGGTVDFMVDEVEELAP